MASNTNAPPATSTTPAAMASGFMRARHGARRQAPDAFAARERAAARAQRRPTQYRSRDLRAPGVHQVANGPLGGDARVARRAAADVLVHAPASGGVDVAVDDTA